MTAALQCKSVPNDKSVTGSLLALNLLVEGVLGGALIVNKSVLAKQGCAVLVAKTIECRLTLELELAKDGVDSGHLPAKTLVGLYLYLNLGMITPVDTLNVLDEVLTTESKT